MKITAIGLAFAISSITPLCAQGISKAGAQGVRVTSVAPFTLTASAIQSGARSLRYATSDYAALKSAEIVQMNLPVSEAEALPLTLTPFSVSANTHWYIATPTGQTETSAPDVTLLRGEIDGEAGSRIFMSVTGDGVVNGYIRRASGEMYSLSPDFTSNATGGVSLSSLAKSAFGELPENVGICGVESPSGQPHAPSLPRARPPVGSFTSSGQRLAKVFIDTDLKFYQLFNNAPAANAYIVTLLGAVSDIYERDQNVRMELSGSRLWPVGGEPFVATDLGGFGTYWDNNENPSLYNLVHLVSGSRSPSYGGIAYLSGVCGGAYGISAYLNGYFPNPVEQSNLGNWDFIVMAHEMGHNFGTYHTHDGYTPTIDDCGNGTPSRGTIMSYCHTFAGYTTNTDLWMHRQVEDVIEAEIQNGACLIYDCNGNGISDALDISNATSLDVNSNAVPDECEDCNGNSILDATEIGLGAPDIDGNGVLDACEVDCNNNGDPDRWECRNNPALDIDGNDQLDACQPDCNNNAVADFLDIKNNPVLYPDFDRNNIPDACQDCNNNAISDWIDLEREGNLFIGDLAGYVREYHATSGYPITNHALDAGAQPVGLAFGPDDMLYVSDMALDHVTRVNVYAGTRSTFVASGSGGLDGAAGLIFHPNGIHLLVSSYNTDRVFAYSATTGALVSTFVSAGSGGLNGPRGMAFGADGHLYVASSLSNSILKYNGATGVLIGTFVSAGSGGLSDPRELAFSADGTTLLVTSYLTDQVLKYNGLGGAFISVFNDEVLPTKAWGITYGAGGDVFVMRTQGTIRCLQYKPIGRYYRPIERGDSGLPTPTDIAFRPQSQFDLNGDRELDDCASCCDLPGDADGNAAVDIGDAVFLISYIFLGGGAPPCLDRADADGNNSVDIGDAVYLITYIFLGGAAPICGTTGN